MHSLNKSLAKTLAGSVLAIALSFPVSAAGIGVGASVGGGGGVSAGAGANVGGSSGVSAGLGASVGGASGVSAGVGANVGGTDGVGVGVGVGGPDPTNTSSTGNPPNPGLSSAVANMSGSQLARMKKRCADVLGNSGGYDRDLRQLCLLVSRR